MGPKKVVVASKVCGAVQVTDDAAVTKPEFAKVYVIVFGFDDVETESPPEPAKVKVEEVMPLSVIDPPPPDPQSLPVPDTVPDAFTWRHCVEPVMPESVRFVVVALPFRMMPPNVGTLDVPIFWGKLKLTIFGELVAMAIWFAAP